MIDESLDPKDNRSKEGHYFRVTASRRWSGAEFGREEPPTMTSRTMNAETIAKALGGRKVGRRLDGALPGA